MNKIIAGKDFAKEIENKRIEILENGLVKVLEPKVWIPKVGDSYCSITANGTVRCLVWQDDEIDFYRLYNGNVFKTEEIAEKVSDITLKFKKLAYEELVDWADMQQDKYGLRYDRYAGSLFIHSCKWNEYQGTDHFKDKEKLEALIEEISKADVIKYYLRIGVNE